MKKTIISAVMLMMLFSFNMAKAEPLNQDQRTKQNIFHGLTVADAVTTIVGVGKGLVESNGILGVAPEPVTVVTFFVARNILHEITTNNLSEKYRDNWLIGSIVLQAGAVVNNLLLIGGL